MLHLVATKKFGGNVKMGTSGKRKSKIETTVAVAHIARGEKRYKVKLMLIFAHQKQKDTQTVSFLLFNVTITLSQFATFYQPQITII